MLGALGIHVSLDHAVVLKQNLVSRALWDMICSSVIDAPYMESTIYSDWWRVQSRFCILLIVGIFCIAMLHLDLGGAPTQHPYELGNLFYGRGRYSVGAGYYHFVEPMGSLYLGEENARSVLKSKLIRNMKLEDSIGGLYTAHSHGRRGDIALLSKIVASVADRIRNETREMSDDLEIWHIRLGDVMDESNAFDGVTRDDGHQTARSRRFYQGILAEREMAPSRVVLLGSYRAGGWLDQIDGQRIANGKEYVQRLTLFLQSRNITVTDYISESSSTDWRSVDKDVIYVSKAKRCLCSSGTFSVLLGALVRFNGGQTMGCDLNGYLTTDFGN